MKVCNKCLQEKDNSFFNKRQYICKDCQKIYNKCYSLANQEAIKRRKKNYRKLNIDKIRIYKQNKHVKDQRNSYIKNKRKSDIEFKIRTNISRLIRRKLKKNNLRKENSTIKILPYSILELKEHLEKQFEPWMTWDNYGKYFSKTWDDNDSSTWTWNIDHIIPQHIFDFSKSEDIKKCWSLENLIPLSAKQNLIKGINFKNYKILDNYVPVLIL